jgi:hypothetical protein
VVDGSHGCRLILASRRDRRNAPKVPKTYRTVLKTVPRTGTPTYPQDQVPMPGLEDPNRSLRISVNSGRWMRRRPPIGRLLVRWKTDVPLNSTRLTPALVLFLMLLPVFVYHPGIPPKTNADSGGNANGIPGRKRTDLGAARRGQLDCAGSVRVPQERPVRSVAEERHRERRKERSPCLRLSTQ